MKSVFFLCVLGVWCRLLSATEFDLKTYERSLKKYIPWSLTGTARDLRSDAKHQLHLILRAFVLLRPEAPWIDLQEPKVDLITQGFKELHAYLALQGNDRKRPWVVDSIAYIVNTYVPEVQKLLDAAQPEGLSPDLAALLDKKRQLLKEFSESLVVGQQEFMLDSDRKA